MWAQFRKQATVIPLSLKQSGSRTETAVALFAGELLAEADKLRASAARLEEMAWRLEPHE